MGRLAIQLEMIGDRSEAGTTVDAASAAGPAGTTVTITAHTPYPSLHQLLLDGEPVAGVWLWLGRDVSDQCPGVSARIDAADKTGHNYTWSVTFGPGWDLLTQPGRHVVSVRGWRGEPGNDFVGPVVDCDFALTVVDRPARLLRPNPAGIPVSLFRLGPEEITSGRQPERTLRRVVNTLETSVFFNPADGGPENPMETFDQWRAAWEKQFLPRFNWMRGHLFQAFAIGDDFFRLPHERAWFTGTPWALDAVKHVSATLASYPDVFIGVECLDEFEGADGFKDVVIPDQFADAWRSVPNHTPISWPGWSIGNGITDDPRRCDYASRYPYASGSWAERGFGPGGRWTLPQVARQVAGMATGVNRSIPLGLMITANPGAGNEADEWTPAAVLAQFFLGALAGGRSFRIYHYADPTTGGRGVKPGMPQWDALVQAVKWLRRYEPWLLDGNYWPPQRVGPWVEGRVGMLRFFLNVTEEPQRLPVRGRVTDLIRFDTLVSGGTVPPGGIVVVR